MLEAKNSHAEQHSTLLGVVAILFWSTTIAFSRSLTEQLGTLTAASLIYIAAGAVGILISAFQRGWLGSLLKLPGIYLFGCGSLFVLYMLCLYLAVGSASTRSDVLAIGLINYLWPGLSLVFSIPILGKRARPFLPAGILIALAGVWLATTSASNVSLAEFQVSRQSLGPYLLALAAAVAWALYSNLSRRWAAGHDGGSVPLFLLASGLVLALLRLFSVETSRWTAQAGLELAYMALFPGMLAYILWDVAVRKGKIILVAALSYITPLLSTVISALILGITPGPSLWLGAFLVFCGAVICKYSVVEPGTHPSKPDH